MPEMYLAPPFRKAVTFGVSEQFSSLLMSTVRDHFLHMYPTSFSCPSLLHIRQKHRNCKLTRTSQWNTEPNYCLYFRCLHVNGWWFLTQILRKHRHPVPNHLLHEKKRGFHGPIQKKRLKVTCIIFGLKTRDISKKSYSSN